MPGGAAGAGFARGGPAIAGGEPDVEAAVGAVGGGVVCLRGLRCLLLILASKMFAEFLQAHWLLPAFQMLTKVR